MKIHKTGYPTLLLGFLVLAIIVMLGWLNLPLVLAYTLLVLAIGFYVFLISFFRNPDRPIAVSDDSLVYAPADGKVVVIEPVKSATYFGDERMQVSIFMSPLNVHVNRSPFAGEVEYIEHKNGKFMPAWNPKSSTDNEQCITVLRGSKGTILLKQIAGALARRIVNNKVRGNNLSQGEEFGFIKFGSRVDLLLPMDAQILVELNQVVKGNIDKVAKLT